MRVASVPSLCPTAWSLGFAEATKRTDLISTPGGIRARFHSAFALSDNHAWAWYRTNAMKLHEVWHEGVWIRHPKTGALVVTSGELAISLVDPSEGFHERRDLEERYLDG